jgi:HTH-type transcriptional regulator/antitoxin HipB
MAKFFVRNVEDLPGLLEAFRKQAGITQVELALRMGITQQSLSRLERNAENIGMRRLLKILSILNVELVLRDGDSRSDAVVNDSPW